MYRILIADDHADIAELWSMLLTEMGYEVHAVHDGPSALEAARKLRPQVVLLDIGLPRLSGLEIARRLRGEFTRQQMVLVAFTGRALDSDKRQAREAGFDFHFVKPIGIEALEQLLARPDLFEPRP